MRISIFAQVGGDDTASGRTVPIGTIERDSLADPASGMGLWVQEAHELLEHIQAVVLDEQADQFIRTAAHCLACSQPLGVEDTKSVIYCTVFGKMSIRSSRFYNCCTECGFQLGDGGTLSTLAKALRERVHPQWAWLQCRYASTMSYRLAQILLRDAFPGGKSLPSSSIKAKVLAVGARLGHSRRQSSVSKNEMTATLHEQSATKVVA